MESSSSEETWSSTPPPELKIKKQRGTTSRIESSSSEETGSPTPPPEIKIKKKRGPAKLTVGKIINDKKVKQKIRFNNDSVPIGTSRKLLSTDCGNLCRAHVPINCRNWKDVTQSVKSKLLEVIDDTYKCKTTKNWQNVVLTRVGRRFRGFKHEMYKKFILPDLDSLDNLRDPLANYTVITPDQWHDFVAQRNSKQFAKIRKQAQEVRKKNKYPHRLSWKGYAGLQEDLQCERNTNEPIERHTLWKMGREKRGAYLDTATREMAERIDDVSNKVEEGTLRVEGSNDVLTQALRTSEHSGRVRGVGSLITPTQYCKKPQPSYQVLEKALKRVDTLNTFVSTLASEVVRLGGHLPQHCPSISPHLEKVGSTSARNSVVGLVSPTLSNSTHPAATESGRKGKGKGKGKRKRQETIPHVDISPPQMNLEKRSVEKEIEKETDVHNDPGSPENWNAEMNMRPCQLALGSIECIVAHGTLMEGGSNLLHGLPMIEGISRVSLDKVLNAKYNKERLPIPHQDVRTLKGAEGFFIAWPSHLVILMHKEANPKASSWQGDFVDASSNFSMLIDRATNSERSNGISVSVAPRVFRTDNAFDTRPKHIYVFSDELLELINFKEIGMTVMKLYMCALYNNVKEVEGEIGIRFVHPAGSQGHSTSTNVEQLFESLDSAQPNDIFLYAYNIGEHWVLVVIDPWRRHALYLDPLGLEMDEKLHSNITYAFSNLNLSSKFKASKNKATIVKAMCPIQPGLVECGYYVLRYMRDIVHSPGTNPVEVFSSSESYEKGHIDEVRVEVMNYMRDNM